MTGDGSVEPAAQAIGRIGCPVGQEANVDEFYFWVAEDQLVEQTQVVRVVTPMGGVAVELFGVVEQVFRRSAISSMQMEVAVHDGDPSANDSLIDPLGVTYAKARVINAFPSKLAPPIEGSTVFACGSREAEHAYQMDEYAAEYGICLGLIRSGGDSTAGRALLDRRFLLGDQSGHLNVNGAAGSGTKSSFLTVATYQTINAVRAHAEANPGSGRRAQVKAIIFNVKGFDLFHLDRWSTKFTEVDLQTWRDMGVPSPGLFGDIAYYAPETSRRSGVHMATNTERRGDVKPYSWSLKDAINFGLFDILFSEDARANDNLVTMMNILQHRLSVDRTKSLSLDERLGGTPDPVLTARRQITDTMERGFNTRNELGNDGAAVRTFQELLDYIESKAQPDTKDLDDDSLRSMSNQTIQAFWRRLRRILGSDSGLLRRDDVNGSPLAIATMQEDVAVIDIQSIRDPHVRRFAIASVLKQLVDWKQGTHGDTHETFLVVIDELNQYAPRDASDAITRLFEYVASQMRSRGIILFGAQQQGSSVSDKVIENSQTRVLGRSGGQEMANSIWRGFSEGDRRLALRLAPDEKVIVAPNFREALHVKVPRPPWAMRREEATDVPPAFMPDAKRAPGVDAGKATPSAEGKRKAQSLEM